MSFQTTPDDALQAATPSIDPKLIQELAEDPAAAQAWFRVTGVLVARDLYKQIHNPEIPFAQKLAFVQMCIKNGNAVPDRALPQLAQNGPSLSLTIVAPDGRRVEHAQTRPALDLTNSEWAAV
jgi:hypothetical protein